MSTLHERVEALCLVVQKQEQELVWLRQQLEQQQKKKSLEKKRLAWLAWAMGVFCVLWGVSSSTTSVQAGIPTEPVLHYAGVVQQNGVPVNSAAASITVELYDAVTAGTVRCSTTQFIPIRDGNFRISLGSSCTQAVKNYSNLYALVKYNGVAIPGRQKLGAVPYAVEAFHATSADTTPYSWSKQDADNRFYAKGSEITLGDWKIRATSSDLVFEKVAGSSNAGVKMSLSEAAVVSTTGVNASSGVITNLTSTTGTITTLTSTDLSLASTLKFASVHVNQSGEDLYFRKVAGRGTGAILLLHPQADGIHLGRGNGAIAWIGPKFQAY